MKAKILNRLPDLEEHKQGRDVLLLFKEETGAAIYEACNHSYEEDGIYLTEAAGILRKHEHEDTTQGNAIGSQEKSVPGTLVTFINMVIGGTNINDEKPPDNNVSLTISQLIRFNLVKHKRRDKSISCSTRHPKQQETPFPLYLSLLLHVTFKNPQEEFGESCCKQRLGVSYDRVEEFELSVSKQLCKKYQDEGLVCPPSIRERLFTTSAIHNIDYNPSSSTAKASFHGTSISVFQHPEENLQAEQIAELPKLQEKEVKLELPENYTALPVTKSN